MTDVVRAVRTALCDKCGVRQGDSILVSVSGGPDSVCLLAVLASLAAEFELTLAVGHVNHGLRRDADRDESSVQALAASLGLPFLRTNVDVRAASGHRRSVQMAARDLRLDALRDMAAQVGARWIALAHQADDQAETVLMRILRGTSPDGLSGIRAVRDDLFIHPLLDVARADVDQYLVDQGLSARQDESNRHRRYLRTRVRLDLLPQLEGQYNPRLRQALCRLAELSAVDRAFLGEVVDREWGKMVTEELIPRHVSVNALAVAKLHPAIAGRVLVRAAIRAGVRGDLPAVRAADLGHLVAGRRRVVTLPGRVIAERHGDRICLSRFGLSIVSPASFV